MVMPAMNSIEGGENQASHFAEIVGPIAASIAVRQRRLPSSGSTGNKLNSAIPTESSASKRIRVASGVPTSLLYKAQFVHSVGSTTPHTIAKIRLKIGPEA